MLTLAATHGKLAANSLETGGLFYRELKIDIYVDAALTSSGNTNWFYTGISCGGGRARNVEVRFRDRLRHLQPL